MNMTTRQSVAGEVYAIMSNFHLPYKKKYSKTFRSRKFMVAVAKQLQSDLEHRTVTLSETETDYVLRVV